MENNLNKIPFTSKLLISLHLLLGIGAVFGGMVLIIDPSGRLIKMPILVAYIFLGLTIQAVSLLPSVQKYYNANRHMDDSNNQAPVFLRNTGACDCAPLALEERQKVSVELVFVRVDKPMGCAFVNL